MQAQATILWGFLDPSTKFYSTLRVLMGGGVETMIFEIDIFKKMQFYLTLDRYNSGFWGILGKYKRSGFWKSSRGMGGGGVLGTCVFEGGLG